MRRAGLYLITDDRQPQSRVLVVLEAALEGGVRAVQLRDKRSTKREFLRWGADAVALCRRYGALVLVNDQVDVALALDADGVHLGQDDLPPVWARRILGPDKLVGLSASHLHEVEEAEAAGADYIGFGSLYPTATKPDAEYAGLTMLRQARGLTSLPLVGIGGITLERVPEVLEAGADGVAVVSAIFGSDDPGRATQDLLNMVAKARSA